ncbi:MAG: AMP-binding protein [Acidobacteriota bacterium]
MTRLRRPAEVPIRPHLASLLRDLDCRGDEPAVVAKHGLRTVRTSYRQLAQLAGRFSRELASRGTQKGDRVVIWGANGSEWIAAFFGCILRGVIPVPLDSAGSPEFVRRVIQEVSPKLVTGSREQIHALDRSVQQIAFEHFDARLPREALLEPVANLSADDTLQIVFTSGTTGEAKGVVHTHRNVLASLGPIEREMQKYLKYERLFHPIGILNTLPLSHVFGQFMGIWVPPLMGAVVHFESRLVGGDLAASIHRERISVLAAVPRVLGLIEAYLMGRFAGLPTRLKAAEGHSALRRWWMFRDVHRALGWKFWALVSGGATLDAEVERFWTTLGFVVVQGYGMTETAALISLNHPFHTARGTIGQVLPGREVRLSEEGEILVKGETVSGATWAGGKMQPRESEWLSTGDLGTVDGGGLLSFRGRKKDVIVTAAGLNIYPEDLEAALLRQPQIRAAAVVEARGPQGPHPLAALVMRVAAEDAAQAVRAANRDLAEFQQIRHWTLWPEPDLPRTSTGKVLRREIAAALAAEPGEKRSGKAASGGLASIIQRITGEDPSALPDRARLSEDAHLDSLGRVELQSALETRFGVPIADAEFQQVQTLGELRELLKSAPAATGPDQHIYPQWTWIRLATAVRTVFLEGIAMPLVALLAGPKVKRNLTQEPDAPLLIVANHVTIYDVPILLYGLGGGMRRRVAVAMAGEMLLNWRHARGQGNWFLNLLAPAAYYLVTLLFNVFPLPQSGDFRASFAHAARYMDRGFHVLVFPEGRRTPDGEMHTFQRGSGLLWTELQCNALPVYLGGLWETKVGKTGWLRSGRIYTHVGDVIMPPSEADSRAATGLLEKRVRSLQGNGALPD